MTTHDTAAELQTAADKLRPSSPAVAAHTVAVRIPPAAAEALADWLGCLATLDPTEREGAECGWCGTDHATTIARAINQPAAETPHPHTQRRPLTESEYNAAWHAVEGAAGEEGADPATVLHAVLDRLGIDLPPAPPVHGCPPDGSGITPCCSRTPFELPRTDRMATDPALVTCKPATPA